MSQSVELAEILTAFQGQRLLAFSKFLQKGSRQIETRVRGGSMGDALPEGSQVRIRFSSEFEMGQVLAYVAGDRIVAHRLVRFIPTRGELYLLTRGDASVFCDAPIRASTAMGIVTEYCTGQAWQAIAPDPPRRVVTKWIEEGLAGAAARVAQSSPKVAIWIGTRIVQIRWAVMNLLRGMRSIGRRCHL